MKRSRISRLCRLFSLAATALLLSRAGVQAQTSAPTLGPVQAEFTSRGVMPKSDSESGRFTLSTALNLSSDHALGPALDDSVGIPSLDRYLNFSRSEKPIAIEVVTRYLVTGPLLVGPIFESWNALSYSPVARDHYYCAPYYERAQSATSVWAMPIIMAITYFSPQESTGRFRFAPVP